MACHRLAPMFCIVSLVKQVEKETKEESGC